MNHKCKTAIFLIVALLLAGVAYRARPRSRSPELFDDQGELFYPEFDPLECAGVQVVDYNKDEGAARVFKVHFRDGVWTIPSHQDYPADAKDQLAKTAAVVNGLRKGAVRSDTEKDYAAYGVADPLNEAYTGVTGRGKRVTLESKTGKVLADLVIGARAGDKYDSHYVRRIDSKRTYACKLDADGISTRFADWVETDLLELSGHKIDRIELDNYRIDERTSTLKRGELIVLTRDGDKLTLPAGLAETEEINTDATGDMKRMLNDMTLVGVRRKPEGLLKAIDRVAGGGRVSITEMARLQLLQSVGYYLIKNDSGGLKVVSNEGELRAYCDDGVVYALRFGEVVYGEPDKISAAPGDEGDKPEEDTTDKAEHRYLFIAVSFDESLLPEKPKEPQEPEDAEEAEGKEGERSDAQKKYEEAKKQYDDDLKEYDKKLEDGRKRAEQLTKRFAEWYYVISADAFKKLHLSRKELVRQKEKKDEGKDGDDGGGELNIPDMLKPPSD